MVLSLFAAAVVLQKGDEMALLDQLERKAVSFFWEESNPKTGLTKDRAGNFKPDSYQVASIASTGFALAAYPIGTERKWLNRQAAKRRTITTLKTILTKLDGTNGWYYHFVNWETGKREWKCELSSIDTSILLAGAIIANEYWKDPEVTKLFNSIMKRVDWGWFMADVDGKKPHEFFNMGWRPEAGYERATWAGYCELLMLYIQAYGFSNVPTTGWDKMWRNSYTYGGYQYLEGGPLFMHQMTNGFYDMSNRRDRQGYSYWVSTRNATLSNRQYCIDNPKHFLGYGPAFWGLTSCDTPDGYRGPGGPPREGDDNGTIAPTCVLASLEYTPKESMEFALGFKKANPKAWGRYGWSNGFNLQRDWVDPDVLGIDLGMMLLGIENYRTGLPHKLSWSNPNVRLGYVRAGLKTVAGSNNGPLKADLKN